MSRYHIVIEDSDGTVVGQFDVGNEAARDDILDIVPDDLTVTIDREIPSDMDEYSSLDDLSDNSVEWDNRLIA